MAAFDSSGLIEVNIVFVNIVNIESDNSQQAKVRNMQDWVLREPVRFYECVLKVPTEVVGSWLLSKNFSWESW